MEEHRRDFSFERMVKRRLMEAEGGGAAQVRRLHVVYYLSRKGGMEHPHLFRVHHLSTDGVRLRDVKRWLRELRGKEVAESFAWSYKRRYKGGYVWQDLLEDDLITPLSDTEYILKGSEISPTITNADQKIPVHKEPSPPQAAAKDHQIQETDMQSASSMISMHESSAVTSTFTNDDDDELGKLEVGKEDSDTINQGQEQVPSSEIVIGTTSKNTNASSEKPNQKHRSCASHVLRNLITCRAVDSDDSVHVVTTKSVLSSDDRNIVHSAETLRTRQKPHMTFGTEHQWIGRTSCDGQKDSAKNMGKLREQRAAACKPLKWPNCSQCGMPFKPEKMHAHMESCKGMKALVRHTGPATEYSSKVSTESRNEYSVSDNFIAHSL